MTKGTISPDQAEQEAKDRCWEPFAAAPAPTDFDPRKQSYWSLAMAVAWICSRDLSIVRVHWNDFRTATTTWKRAGPGRQPQRLGGVTLAEMIESDRQPTDKSEWRVMRPSEGFGDLRRQLSEGTLSAVGEKPNGLEATIPKNSWLNGETLGEGDVLSLLGGAYPSLKFTNMRVPTKDILNFWRPLDDADHQDGKIEFGELQDFVPLGIAILWLGCKGQDTATAEIVVNALDEEGAKILFPALATDKARATGFRPGSTDELSIPAGDWKSASLSSNTKANWVTLDDPVKPQWDRNMPDRQFGGSIRGTDRRRSIVWHDIRISRAELTSLAHSEAASLSPGTPRQEILEDAPDALEAVQRKLGTVRAMQDTLRSAQKYLTDRQLCKLTREEAESLLVRIHRGTREIRRKAVEKEIKAHDKRRRPGDLVNRDKYLDDCRQFLSSAT